MVTIFDAVFFTLFAGPVCTPASMPDWFHITIRLTVLKQFAKGMIRTDAKTGKKLLGLLTSTKWYLWYGNVARALESVEDCCLEGSEPTIAYGNIKTFAKKLDEFQPYIDNNSPMIPDYGEKWRYSETITTAFVESTVNEVVAKRMVKKQQMQWTPEGAHNLLQTRTATLNGDLSPYFERWYSGFPVANEVNHDLHEVKLAA